MAGNGQMDAQDSQQNTRLEIDIGDDKTMTIEITLRGRLTLQSTDPPRAVVHAEEEGRALPDRAVEEQESLDKKNYKMRGYLMVVCTLFIAIAFQAAMQPPSWIPNDWYRVYKRGPSPAPDTSTTTTYAQARRARDYMLLSAVNFAIPVVLVSVLLLKRIPATHLIQTVMQQLPILCFPVAWAFVVGSASDPGYTWYFYLTILIYGACTALHLLALRGRDLRLRRQMAEADDPSLLA
ncbi:uncharacterized protein [Triticum aestivum]|uniref:uncharacterized protein n=1 Tax=Triticum aestivum TaxID=4565 RepID=UPI001D01185D|nr:uncharacterized protein LOC123131317 [Triticum aestivum]